MLVSQPVVADGELCTKISS